MIRLSIRARIALASALVAALLLAVVALLTAVQARAASSDTATALARADLMPFATDLRTQPDEAPDAASPGALVLIRDPHGTVRRDSMPAAVARAAVDAADGGTIRVAGVSYRVASSAVRGDGGVWRLIAVRDLTVAAVDAARIDTTLAVAVPLVALGIGAVAWLVATLTLRPVERMRRAAERLRATGEPELLPEGPASDELAALGSTLNGLLDDLRTALEAERRLTADAGHELRTPIAVLQAQVELVGSPPSTAEIGGIRASTARLAVLADDLLELSRPRPSTAVRTPVGALTTEAMDAVDRGRLLTGTATSVDLALDPVLDELAETRIEVTAFGRVLANLIGNAVAATAAGEVTVRLATTPTDLEVRVVDSGTGIADEFLPHAFERFSRPDDAGGRSGAGLGLAVVRRLVEDAGGSAAIENGARCGAVATVRLPIEATGETHRRDHRLPLAELPGVP